MRRDLGADVEGASSEPWTSLESAVPNNRLDLATIWRSVNFDLHMTTA